MALSPSADHFTAQAMIAAELRHGHGALERRIAELEQENAALRAELAQRDEKKPPGKKPVTPHP